MFTKRYQLLDLADQYNLPSIFDLLDKIKPTNSTLACTDGKTIYVNFDEFNARTVEDQFFILCHELLHIIYKHNEMGPPQFSNRKLLNVCQDIVINEFLSKRLKYKTSDGIYLKDITRLLIQMHALRPWCTINYTGILSTEDLYNYLSNFLHNDEFDNFIDNYESDQIDGDDDSTDEELARIMQDVTSEVVDTLKITNEILSKENPDLKLNNVGVPVPGVDTGTLKRAGGKVNYIARTDLIKFMKNYIGTNAVVKGRSRTYSRPNRRFQSNDLLMKGYKNTKTIKKIAVYLDTSGSMSDSFVFDIYRTLSVLNKTTDFYMYTFDTSVHKVDFTDSDNIYVGGGTDINFVLRHIEHKKHDVAFIITDCEDNFSIDNVSSEVMMFTNNTRFTSTNPHVKVQYWK